MRIKLITIFSATIVVFLIMLPSSVFGETPLFEVPESPKEPLIPGRIEGTGTYFEIEDSEYLNITLKSTEEIKVVLESIPRMISLDIEAGSESIDSAELTIEGLEPNKTYYKYQDSYKNEAVFISDENGSFSWEQNLSQPHHIWLQEEKGTIYLPDDCNKYGTWDEGTKTCTLTQDLTQSVEITASYVNLDCKGHNITSSASGTGHGIYLIYKNHTTIKNCNVTQFSYGIFLSIYSFSNNITNNNVSNNYNGIGLYGSSNNITNNNVSNNNDGIYLSGFSSNSTVTNNNIAENSRYGVFLLYSSKNIIKNNIITNNPYGISLYFGAHENTISDNTLTQNGLFVYAATNNRVENNTVNGKPLVYLENVNDYPVEDAGQVIAVNSKNITVEGLNLSYASVGIQFIGTKNSKIINNILSNNLYGIYGGSDNAITNNTITTNAYGIYLGGWNNNIIDNTISNNSYGIRLSGSLNNTITNNVISNNNSGLFFWWDSLNNSVYHNNFLNNTVQGYYTFGGITNTNRFDNDYPRGGNYWTDYTGADLYSGPNQDEPGSDGIGDIPYTFYWASQDRYPFMKESGWEAPPEEDEEWLFNVAVILAETSDVPHESSSITVQPCKLRLKKTYPQGRDKEYFEDLLYCVTDYHKENSFGKVNLNFKIYDNDGEWFKTDKSESYYAKNEIELVKNAETLAGIDPGAPEGEKIVIVVHSGESSRWKPWKIRSQTWSKSNEIIIAEDDLVRTWAHEVGHVLGVKLTPENTTVPDLYNMGNVGKWDVMAGTLFADRNNPPYMNSYTKEFLQWLNYDIYSKSAYGEYWINSLETSEFGDKVFRYNLSDDTNDESPKYYILETRNRTLKTWDSSLPEEKALVLYKVDTKGYPEYGYDSKMVMNNQYRKINIPFFDGILTPDGDSHLHLDMEQLIYISALSDEQTSDTYRIKSKIEKVGYDFFEDRFQGMILDPLSQLYNRTIQYLPFQSPQLISSISASEFSFYGVNTKSLPPLTADVTLIDWFTVKGEGKLKTLILVSLFSLLLIWLNKKIIFRWRSEKGRKTIRILKKILWVVLIITLVIYICLLIVSELFPKSPRSVRAVPKDNLRPVSALTPEAVILPDLDLHLYCDDGKHIGMNYETGEYENQIPKAIVSGNNQDAPEWIFIPESINNCNYFVSSYSNQKFLEENPKIAQEIEDTTDSYEVYARYIDNETAIYTSTVISENEPRPKLATV